MQAAYWQGEVQQRRKNGEIYPTLVTMSAVYDDAKHMTHRIVVFNDLSRFKQYEARLDYLAHYDALTDLPNRASFQLRLQNALARAEQSNSRISLLIINLDQFKTINDTLGHGIGDSLLKQIARRLQEHLRKADLLARFGGDEFAIMIEDLPTVQAAAEVAEQLRQALERPFDCEHNELFVSGSIGIACFPEDGNDAATLLKNADAAMHQAKQEGRNTHRFFSAQINAHSQEYLQLANNLRYALERRQLHLHYQPCIDLNSNRIVSVEALLRWQHPELGNISPAKFIPIAESTGLIAPIGKWVLEEACRQAKQWQNRGYDLRMAVNLSARQFRDADLLCMVEEILQNNALDARSLELEITESMLMENPELARKTLQCLSELGVTIAIDDFGTGYSSLSYLKEFIFNFIKIDQSFVSKLPEDRNDAVITRTIIAMAKNLQIQVIAEGVETEAQRNFLQEYGCDEGQGYLFSKPLPADRLEALLATHTTSV
jgi:diguanylate cyclase (GGDEF)-like protein